MLDLVFRHVEEFLSPELDPELVRTRPLRSAMPGYIPSSLLARGECFERVGGFDETLENGAWFDWYMRAQSDGLREVVLDDVYVRRRIHGTTTGPPRTRRARATSARSAPGSTSNATNS